MDPDRERSRLRDPDNGPSLTVDTAMRPGEETVQTAARHFRTDIQLMRAWAVLAVVINHAGLPFLPGGFLGVDIFFVISGYLMTGLIDEALANGRFTFAGFYARRVRRLLPAAYATLTVTAIAAPFLLDATEYHNFVAQLAGAFSFTANIVLWKQADYFGTQAAMKPLLHIWSLSLEEQYYLVLPFALFLCPRRFRLALSVAVAVVSGAACALLMARSVSAAFYFLPSRAWELAIGSVVAMAVRRGIVRPVAMGWLRLACVVVILAVPALAGEAGHPGWAALTVCLATAVLLVPGAVLGAGGERAVRPLAAIGDRSYSLYLVHWPLLAFASNIFVASVPLWVNVALLGVAAIWTELQYRLVEQPLRRFAINGWSVAVLILLPLVVTGATWGIARSTASPDMAMRVDGAGLSPACDYRGDFAPVAACSSGPAPRTLVWGDSFAMALAPGMAASSPGGIVQATRTVCGPLVGLSPINGTLYNRAWGERCASFNDSVLAYLGKHPEIDTVVMSSVLAPYVPGAEQAGWRLLVRTPQGFAEQPQRVDAVVAALADTVRKVRALGKRVVLVAPPPASGDDIARCLERVDEGKPVVAAHPDCTIAVGEYHRHRVDILAFLRRVRTQEVVPVLDFDARLCRNDQCQTRLGATILYRDKDHLSGPGSVALGKDMDWGAMVARLAK